MADALVYADKTVGADKIIELSTLTGACMVALGDGMAGLWATDDDLATGLEGASKESGDKIWRMPLEDSYREQLKSKIADMKKPYAHVDIAGPVWSAKSGATGFGAKLV